MAWYIAGKFASYFMALVRLLLLSVIACCTILMVVQVKEFNTEFKSFNVNLDKFNQNIPVLVYGVGSVHRSVEKLTDTVNERHKEIRPELTSFNGSFETLNYYLPYLINESYSIRKELPGILSEIEKIVGQAEDVSKAASEGAVEGAMRGVLSLPAEVISSIISLPYEAVKKTGEKVKKKRVVESQSEPLIQIEQTNDMIGGATPFNVDKTNTTPVESSESEEVLKVTDGRDEGKVFEGLAEPEIFTDENTDTVQDEVSELKAEESAKMQSDSTSEKL
ncbi:hypothetical protein [Alteromonas macleodii]|uniref:hypothetical protein n=1 Tax=Alteromonas macleodii TaxID=28108 RepID=UPI00314098CB|tara:strand:+ start:201784 stop:202617 length:834 start_codon:yes stop_codon:yes gene_type:complete